jgi:hypothetical protein
MLCLSYYAYVFSSTKSVIMAEPDLPGTEGRRRRKRGRRAGSRKRVEK